jgi:NADPH-dependent 2,4-dienoyl-CoA reductase/sulfur reductase-like enzyme
VTDTAAAAPPRNIVVVGASLAGARTAEALRLAGYDGGLTIVGAEAHWPPYDRPPLSKQLLTGQWETEQCRLRIQPDVADKLLLDVQATRLDPVAQQVWLSNGDVLGYDRLVIATGARPRTLRNTAGITGVHYLRTLEDCLSLRAAMSTSRSVAIVGAGFIGCEVASACRAAGLSVTLIDALPTPLAAVVGGDVGNVIAGVHSDHGVRVRCGVTVVALRGRDRVKGLVLSDGSYVAADLVVIGVGAIPNTEWLAGSGLPDADGVACGETSAVVGAPSVCAVGDVACAYHPRFDSSMRLEHWSGAVSQARIAAAHMLGQPPQPPPLPYFWSDQYDLHLQFVGLPAKHWRLLEGTLQANEFVVGYHTDGRLTGALCFNRPARLARLRRMIGGPVPADLNDTDTARSSVMTGTSADG